MSMYDILLCLTKHRNRRVWNKQINTFVLVSMGTITMENFKYIKWNFPNIACLTQDNLPGEVQLVFVYATVGNPSLGVPILYPTLAGNRRV